MPITVTPEARARVRAELGLIRSVRGDVRARATQIGADDPNATPEEIAARSQANIPGITLDQRPPTSLAAGAYRALQPQTVGIQEDQEALEQSAAPTIGERGARFVGSSVQGAKDVASGLVGMNPLAIQYNVLKNEAEGIQTGDYSKVATAPIHAIGGAVDSFMQGFGGAVNYLDAPAQLIKGDAVRRGVRTEGAVGQGLRVLGTAAAAPVTEAVGRLAEATGAATREQRGRTWRAGHGAAAGFGYDVEEAVSKGEGFMTLGEAVARTQGYKPGSTPYRLLQLGGFAADSLLPVEHLTVGPIGKTGRALKHTAGLRMAGVSPAIGAAAAFGHEFPRFISKTSIADVGKVVADRIRKGEKMNLSPELNKHISELAAKYEEEGASIEDADYHATRDALKDVARGMLGADAMVHIADVGYVTAKEMPDVLERQRESLAGAGGRIPIPGEVIPASQYHALRAAVGESETLPQAPEVDGLVTVTEALHDALVAGSMRKAIGHAPVGLVRWSPIFEGMERIAKHPSMPAIAKRVVEKALLLLPGAGRLGVEFEAAQAAFARKAASLPEKLLGDVQTEQAIDRVAYGASKIEGGRPLTEILYGMLPEGLKRKLIDLQVDHEHLRSFAGRQRESVEQATKAAETHLAARAKSYARARSAAKAVHKLYALFDKTKVEFDRLTAEIAREEAAGAAASAAPRPAVKKSAAKKQRAAEVHVHVMNHVAEFPMQGRAEIVAQLTGQIPETAAGKVRTKGAPMSAAEVQDALGSLTSAGDWIRKIDRKKALRAAKLAYMKRITERLAGTPEKKGLKQAAYDAADAHDLESSIDPKQFYDMTIRKALDETKNDPVFSHPATAEKVLDFLDKLGRRPDWLADPELAHAHQKDIFQALADVSRVAAEAERAGMQFAASILQAFLGVPNKIELSPAEAKAIGEAFAKVATDDGAALQDAVRRGAVESVSVPEGMVRLIVKEMHNEMVADYVKSMVEKNLIPDLNGGSYEPIVKAIEEIMNGQVPFERVHGRVHLPPSLASQYQIAAKYIDQWGMSRVYDVLNVDSKGAMPATISKAIDEAVQRGGVPQFGLRQPGQKGLDAGLTVSRYTSWLKTMMLVSPLSPVGAVGYLMMQGLGGQFNMINTEGLRGTVKAMKMWADHPQLLAALLSGETAVRWVYDGGPGTSSAHGFVSETGEFMTYETLKKEIEEHNIARSQARVEFAEQIIETMLEQTQHATPLSHLTEAMRAAQARLKGTKYRTMKQARPGVLKGLASTMRAWTKLLFDAADVIDNAMRLPVYLEHRRKGESPAQSARAARLAVLDFGNLTHFEQTVLRKMFLFYAFSRANFDSYVHALMVDPSRVARQARFLREAPRAMEQGIMGEEEDKTRWMRDSDKGRIYFGSGEGPEGTQGEGYVSSTMPIVSFINIVTDMMGALQDAVNLPRPDPDINPGIDLVQGSTGQTIKDLVGASHPIAQTAFESATGESTGGFTLGEKSSDNRIPGWLAQLDQLAGGALFDEVGGIYTAKRSADPTRKWMGEEVTYYARNETAWRNIQRLLGLSGSLRSYDRLTSGVAPGFTPIPLQTKEKAVQNATYDIADAVKKNKSTLKKRAEGRDE